ncbi:MAG: type II toxin-antitoxin system RelE/ParE family toxin [Methylobacteriaceae bacterium]|nr:type II toxin-antitoxin system RelE/ParE family toxin [Methylobacteriaceae bacterium]
MRRRQVVVAPEARNDLLRIYERIEEAAGPGIALSYIEGIEAYCLGFDLASGRNRERNDIRPGLRIVGFELRVTVAFTVDADRVAIPRLFYGEQDWEQAFYRCGNRSSGGDRRGAIHRDQGSKTSSLR